MELFLTRQSNGLFMLTVFKPTKYYLYNDTNLIQDVYIQPGEPVGIRNLCRRGIIGLFGKQLALLKRLNSIKIDLVGTILEQGENE